MEKTSHGLVFESGDELPLLDFVTDVKRMPYCLSELAGSQIFNGTRRGCVAEYNANNTWYFNGNNRCLNNNNRYNGNFRSRPVFDFGTHKAELLLSYLVKLSEIVALNREHRNSKNGYTAFSVSLMHNLATACHRINSMDVQIQPLRGFVVTVPKTREVLYCEYADKLIQTFYASQLSPYLEDEWFVNDSYSCRKGKGVIAAVDRAVELIREVCTFKKS